MGSVTAYEPSHPAKQRNTAEYGTAAEPYYCSNALQRTSGLERRAEGWKAETAALAGLVAFSLLALVACGREQKRPERTEPWPAPSAAPSGSAEPAVRRARYELTTSELAFVLPAKHASPRGRFRQATGHFEVDLEAAERSSGSVRVDLELIELETAPEDAGVANATRRALEWLELGSETPPADRASRRFATFVLRGLEETSGPSLLRLSERRDGTRSRFDAVVVGELSLHGVRAPARVPVSLEIEAPSAPGAPPRRLMIRSRKPLVVSLGVHDIRPRDARGVLVARELSLLGESVGREAKLSFELTLDLRP
jgi:polyisoprenoid-binding protein YceI